MTIINPATFTADGRANPFGQPGTVEVTLHSETRRLPALENQHGIHVQGISGRLKGGRKAWNLRLSLRPHGREDIEVYESPAPSLQGKSWASFTFGPTL